MRRKILTFFCLAAIAIGDEVKPLSFRQSASRLIHRHGGGQRIALGRDMVSGNLMRVGIQKQKRKVMLTGNAVELIEPLSPFEKQCDMEISRRYGCWI